MCEKYDMVEVMNVELEVVIVSIDVSEVFEISGISISEENIFLRDVVLKIFKWLYLKGVL